MEWTYKTIAVAVFLIIVLSILGKRKLRNAKKKEDKNSVPSKELSTITQSPEPEHYSSQRAKNPLAIPDKFNSLEEVQCSLRESGLETSNLIIGVDYTKSNEFNGTRCFKGKSLHYMSSDKTTKNPYQQVISILGSTLESFDEDKRIPTFGFGDAKTTDQSCFPFYEESVPFKFSGVLQRYDEITPTIEMSGPTNFAPIIYKAIDIVKESKQYHILIIIADGEVINIRETAKSIEEASNFPLSIICVGVGDGPFELMQRFDDELPKRKFDNFQFVNFTKVMQENHKNQEAEFARRALMEIPDQYKTICNLGYITV